MIKALVAGPVLTEIHKRYYLWLMDGERSQMETDSEGVKLLVRPGDFVIDIGAFVGFYTQMLANAVGGDGQVLSFEPIPETYAILDFILRKRCMRNVTAINAAVSDRAGTAVMEIPRYPKYGESMYDARITDQPHPGWKTRSVKRIVLDDFAQPDRPVCFIKVDVEGHEVECLTGARRTIERWTPAMLVETVETGPQPIADLLKDCGYAPFEFTGAGFQPLRAGSRPQNVFFLTGGHLADVPLNLT